MCIDVHRFILWWSSSRACCCCHLGVLKWTVLYIRTQPSRRLGLSFHSPSKRLVDGISILHIFQSGNGHSPGRADWHWVLISTLISSNDIRFSPSRLEIRTIPCRILSFKACISSPHPLFSKKKKENKKAKSLLWRQLVFGLIYVNLPSTSFLLLRLSGISNAQGTYSRGAVRIYVSPLSKMRKTVVSKFEQFLAFFRITGQAYSESWRTEWKKACVAVLYIGAQPRAASWHGR